MIVAAAMIVAVAAAAVRHVAVRYAAVRYAAVHCAAVRPAPVDWARGQVVAEPARDVHTPAADCSPARPVDDTPAAAVGRTAAAAVAVAALADDIPAVDCRSAACLPSPAVAERGYRLAAAARTMGCWVDNQVSPHGCYCYYKPPAPDPGCHCDCPDKADSADKVAAPDPADGVDSVAAGGRVGTRGPASHRARLWWVWDSVRDHFVRGCNRPDGYLNNYRCCRCIPGPVARASGPGGAPPDAG